MCVLCLWACFLEYDKKLIIKNNISESSLKFLNQLDIYFIKI